MPPLLWDLPPQPNDLKCGELAGGALSPHSMIGRLITQTQADFAKVSSVLARPYTVAS